MVTASSCGMHALVRLHVGTRSANLCLQFWGSSPNRTNPIGCLENGGLEVAENMVPHYWRVQRALTMADLPYLTADECNNKVLYS